MTILEQAMRTAAIQSLDYKIGLDKAEVMFRTAMIMEAMERNDGNQSHAAKELGKHRNTLGRDCPIELKPKIQRALRKQPARATAIPSKQRMA